MIEPQPREVRRWEASVRENGFEPMVRQLASGEWEVAIEGEHIRATAILGRKPGNRRTQFLRGELFIDGEKQPQAASFAELRELWDEREGGEQEGALMEIADPGARPVPAVVTTVASRVASALGGRLGARTGICGEHWVIGADFDGDTGLRFVFTRSRGIWNLDPRHPVQLFIEGTDRSEEAGGDIEKALSLAVRSYPVPDSDKPAGKPRAGFRDNGIETRRRVVIRELRGQA